MAGATSESRLGAHAVYPGTFDPVTPGHLDVIERARHLFARVTVLVAVNSEKKPARTQPERVLQLRRDLPASWDNVSVTEWTGLTVAFCREHGGGVIIRGVRNGSDLGHEYQLAAMTQDMGITTLLLPANPELAAISSTLLRGIAAGGNLPELSGEQRFPPAARTGGQLSCSWPRVRFRVLPGPGMVRLRSTVLSPQCRNNPMV
jgi:pantetheine-phosphate adenylyltransferase